MYTDSPQLYLFSITSIITNVVRFGNRCENDLLQKINNHLK